MLTNGTHCSYYKNMKYHRWDQEKNEKLKKERGFSFDDIIYYIQKGSLLGIIKHQDQQKYKGQKIYIVRIEDYVYLVPFVETKEEVFLKAIIPSRKATKQYLEEK